MSKSVNKWFGLGNIGKDPEIRTSPSGTVVANFSIAVSDREKDSSGNWTDKTTWIDCVCFKKTAEIVQSYVTKGSKIFVEGKITNRSWDDKKTGEKRYKSEIIINDITLLSGKEEAGGRQEESAPAPAKRATFQDVLDDPNAIPF
jgi:single-strand DNA-binding protein